MKQPYIPLQKQTFIDSSPLARRLLWHPYSIGTIYLDEPDHHQPFEKPGAHLFWAVSGRGILETQGHQYTLKADNHVWFIDMMKPRTYVPQVGTRLTIRGIRFGGPGLEMWHEQLGGNFKAEFDLEDASSIHQAYAEISKILKGKPSDWEWRVHVILMRTLGFLLAARRLGARDHVELPLPLVRVLNAIESNPFYDWKVKNLASIAGVSHSGLRALFQASQHESLHAYIQRSRLDQARLLLADQRLSLKQIAEQLHFSSEFYFSHFFKKGEGMSPSQYRSQLKEKR